MYHPVMIKHEWSDHVSGLRHQGGEPHLLLEIMRTQRALMNAFSRRMRMPFSRMTLLRVLALAYPGEIGVLDIARRLNVNGAAVTRQIKEMEQLGLVARRSDRRDGRRQQLRLSAKGRRLFEQLHDMQHGFESSLMTGSLDPDEVRTAARVLFRLRSELENMDMNDDGQEVR